MNLMTGAFAENGPQVMRFHVGANMDQNKQVFIGTMTAAALIQQGDEEAGTLDLSNMDAANTAIGTLDEALKKVSKQRADLGGYQNRFEEAAKGVAIAAENLQASESRIRDANMATEVVSFTKNQILSQAGNAMLAQANVQTQSVLQLLG
jgi:flagellin